MAQPILLPSFAGGELSPKLYSRVDLAKYHVGAALLRNFTVDFRGGVSTRQGMEFICRAHNAPNDPIRLLPFEVSTLQTYIIELGVGYMRFLSNGAQVVETGTVITGATAANPVVVTDVAHGYVDGDEVVVSGVLGMTQLNGKNFIVDVLTVNTYSLKNLDGTPIDGTSYTAYTSGGLAKRVFTLVSPYTATELFQIKYVQSADVLTLTHPNHPPHNLTRTSPSTFLLTPISLGPKIGPPQNLTATPGASSPNFAYGYVVTAVSEETGEESLASASQVALSVIQDQTDAAKCVDLDWDAPSSEARIYKIYKWGVCPAASPYPTVYGLIGQTTDTAFTDCNFAPDFSHTPPQFKDPFTPGQIKFVTIVNPGWGYTADTDFPLTIGAGTSSGTGAAGFAHTDGDGRVVSVTMTSFGRDYDATATFGITGTPLIAATFSYDPGPSNGSYPACVTYFQQRRVYGATASQPETMEFSQTGQYDNFDTSLVVVDSDAIEATVASRSVNAIKSMVPMSTGLVTFTTGGGFLVSGGSGGAALTPSSISALPQASEGANDLAPLVVNYDILYVQNRGTRIRDLSFNYYLQSYQGSDVSALAEHLFEDRQILDWSYASEPSKLIWCVLDNGNLASMAFVPDQEVTGWSRHDTQGDFLSVAQIPEGNTNAVYFAVRRRVGPLYKIFIERVNAEFVHQLEDAFCVDAGLRTRLTYPAAKLTVASATGTSVDALATASIFAPTDVNKIIWGGGGKARVTTYISPTLVRLNILKPLTNLIPNDPQSHPRRLDANDWSMDAPITRVDGLDHLIGMVVTGLADGQVIEPVRVDTLGGIDVPQATKVSVGLGFQCQMQTLRLDIGEPTVQGKKKLIPTVTLRLNKSSGLLAGTDWSTLRPLKELQVSYTPPVTLVSADIALGVGPNWTTEGQICIQQDLPLPATILGIIPQVVIGDTGR